MLPGIRLHVFEKPSAGIIAWRKNERAAQFLMRQDEECSAQERANGKGAWDQRSMRAAIWNTDVHIAPHRQRLAGLLVLSFRLR